MNTSHFTLNCLAIHVNRRTAGSSGGNRKESLGKEVEVAWECDETRGALHRKEGDGNEVQGRRKRGRSKRECLDTARDDTKEKGLSGEEVHDRATWRRMSSYIDPT